ncbi:endolytic transglycosylase MltG [bacterium]|nr:endolytic transglycosylase MltG [bacterium]
MKRRSLRIVLVAGTSLLFLILIAWWYLAGEGAHPERSGEERIVVQAGASAWSVGRQLERAELIKSARRFVYHLKFRGKSMDLRAGTYDVPRTDSMRDMADRILTGNEVVIQVTIPEGISSHKIAGLFASFQVCDSLAFEEAVHDLALKKEFAAEGRSLEGYLFPETYTTRLNREAKEVVREMVSTFFEVMGQEWLDAAGNDPLGVNSIVTLASIVQGEIQLSDEAGDVAALYRNRLVRGMKLQADPTVQYVVPGEPRRLSLRDLRIDSPYNTYMYKGLPPGPINNPGKVALEAALSPPERPWIYMVAKGDGGHTFTTTYEDHLEAKKRLDAIRRMVDRQKKYRNF